MAWRSPEAWNMFLEVLFTAQIDPTVGLFAHRQHVCIAAVVHLVLPPTCRQNSMGCMKESRKMDIF